MENRRIKYCPECIKDNNGIWISPSKSYYAKKYGSDIVNRYMCPFYPFGNTYEICKTHGVKLEECGFNSTLDPLFFAIETDFDISKRNYMIKLYESDPFKFDEISNNYINKHLEKDRIQRYGEAYLATKKPKIKCPTCQSANVEKISFGSKMFGAMTLGFFSSNVRNTFRCKSCGYKW